LIRNWKTTTSILLSLALWSCGASPISIKNLIGSKGIITDVDAQNAAGARVSFHYSDYYSLFAPAPGSNCPGDAKTFYDPFKLSGGVPQAFNSSQLSPGTTFKPDFLKNISVDITNANSNIPSNASLSCSYGASVSAPPSSTCATFDYGAIGGISTNLGGSFFLAGGVQDISYATIYPIGLSINKGTSLSCGPVLSGNATATSCSPSVYALAVDSLPPSAATDNEGVLAPGLGRVAPTEAISSWANLSGGAGYTGPKGAAGGGIALSPGAQKIVLFAGATPLPGQAPSGLGSDTVDTWIFDLKNQKWTNVSAVPGVDPAILNLKDYDPAATFTYNLARSSGSRSAFGYTAAPAVSLNSMSTTGAVTSANIDTTERILIAGGAGPDPASASFTLKFNPTYGPEWVDSLGRQGAAPAAGSLVQWIESYHSQLMSNYTAASRFAPSYPSNSGGVSNPQNFGMTTVRNLAGGFVSAGMALFAGGFDPALQNTDNFGVVSGASAQGGRMSYAGYKGTAASPETFTGNYIRIPDDVYGNRILEQKITTLTERSPPDAAADATPRNGKAVPWMGGVTLLPGFSLTNNDVVYFGGSSCRDYLTDPTATGCNFTNKGRYWRLSAVSLNSVTVDIPVATLPATTGIGDDWNTSKAPARAGMAAARGEDGAGNIIIVSWGGMSAPVTSNDNNLYVLYNNNGTPSDPLTAVPKWGTYVPTSAEFPISLTNSAMVYSHVTRKFYIFGGHQVAGNIITQGDTWELSVTGACPNCTFAWKKLNKTGGTTCYPECPQPRRSHRMIEVNYNYTPANTNPVTLEPVCTNAAAPCSFGIFMEGGTKDGASNFSDRWMFDPTANAGLGHWQRVDGFPPRHFTSMASVEYFLPGQNKIAHRAILFGGETALHSPESASLSAAGAPQYFVPPTLGDTYVYDFDNQSWNRAQLLGKGYVGALPSGLTEFEKRQAYIVNPTAQAAGFYNLYNMASPTTYLSPEIAELSPPPTSGAIMVTRTHPSPISDNAGLVVQPLAIPQVFMIGGRTKDGQYQPLDRVYKFCLGSTGEKPASSTSDDYDDATCDYYDSTYNPDSQSPVPNYMGRWLRKKPRTAAIDPNAPVGASYDVDPSAVKTFLGAGAYDPDRDKVLVYGGLGGDPVTKTVGNKLYEYTPSSANYDNPGSAADDYAKQGYWRSVPACTGYTGATAPAGRYGHTMGYDHLTKQVVMVGGYDVSGLPITQTQTYYDGRTYRLPEVWTGKRISGPGPATASGPEIPSTGNTFPCYYWAKKTTFGNSIDIPTQAPPVTGLGHMASVFLPGTGYNTGFYSTFDDACINAGPISTSDPQVSKLLAGGAYIDIDRGSLGSQENLLLNITYIPLSMANQRPDGAPFGRQENAFFKVHLVRSGLSADAVKQTFQPRYMTFSDQETYPEVVQTLSVMAAPNGSVRQDQIVLPISVDPTIDRIRIERYSGSAILIDATVLRMGRH
jgi:hypothetical protein